MSKFRNFLRKFRKSESGQGTAEYVLLLVIVVSLVVIFKDKIKSAISEKTDEVKSSIMGVKAD